MFQGTTRKILARMEAEKKNPVVDVVVLASLPAMEGLKKEGQTLAYKEAKQADKLRSECDQMIKDITSGIVLQH